MYVDSVGFSVITIKYVVVIFKRKCIFNIADNLICRSYAVPSPRSVLFLLLSTAISSRDWKLSI